MYRTLFLTLIFFYGSDAVTRDTEVSLDKALKSLEHLLDYFQSKVDEINLDAIIGTRMVSDQLTVLLGHIVEAPYLNKAIIKILPSINRVQQKAGKVSDDSIPYLKKHSPNYLKKLYPILEKGFWVHDYPSQKVDPNFLFHVNYKYPNQSMTEEQSDNCLAEILGTRPGITQKCLISERCWRRMTKIGYRWYSLTHELFYLEIGTSAGCLPQLEEFAKRNNQPNTDILSKIFCTNILKEALHIANSGFPEDKRDLFMEQAALCSLVGYKQFIQQEWLDTIISWQRSSGCYGLPQPETSSTNVAHELSRNKRREKELSDGCLSHGTAVASCALGAYVRALAEDLIGL